MEPDLRAWGDRSNSIQSALPCFKAFRIAEHPGQVRWVELGDRVWFAGSEPWAPPRERAKLAWRFIEEAQSAGAHAVIGPIGPELAGELKRHKGLPLRVICVGAEARFSRQRSIHVELARLPLARALLRKGYVVDRKSGAELVAAEREAITTILADRSEALAREGREELGLLSSVDPFFLSDARQYYFVRNPSGAIEAYGSFQPMMSEGQVVGYYAAEYFRSSGARAGVIELLLCQAATELPALSLGLSPFAVLPREPLTRLAGWLLYHLGQRPFSPKSMHRFKQKLGVTEWRPMYLAVAPGVTPRIVRALARVFVSPKIAACGPVLTSLLFIICVALHYGSVNLPAGFYEASGYRTQGTHLWGWVSGPFLHNHAYHLWGDLLSLAMFGAAYEWLRGPRAWLLVVAAGLWLSNPLSHLLILPFGPAPEVDYGSSNAVYALVGAVATVVSQPWLLLAPFILNGLWVMLGKGSCLAIHHWVALALGWWIGSRVERKSP